MGTMELYGKGLEALPRSFCVPGAASTGGFSGAVRDIYLFSVTVLSMRLLITQLKKKSPFLYTEEIFVV